ncbi:TetR/AcrR family transcriptional regulator [Acidipila sp. EB88]|uniref:TetR/AcrR family transcriptional regulator n=1 Tax=Acidipila sp. EB88 TaxID=2305226 RepID=UPI000F5FE7BD|nr:TetR/AcrR family transcriptional regulator [Acidipila sp. EB88]RRA48987.1 TetR/AcrR family transcriptional regulator [Acidipila sp. EB88]
MPRARSDDKRSAILAAATHLIVAQGLGAPTMGIARQAGIPNGSLFTYFPTKAALFNQLYLELKQEMAAAATANVEQSDFSREHFFQIWHNWMHWAVAFPEKRKALTQLDVSDAITPETRAAAHRAMRPLGALIEHCRAAGPMSKVPAGFVAMLLNAAADATMVFMTQDPKHARRHCKDGFDAAWRMLS